MQDQDEDARMQDEDVDAAHQTLVQGMARGRCRKRCL
jgi:hypothetical protein